MATILVVEDNPTNMKLAITLLEAAGHSVLTAVDAEAGLMLARSEKPDLILMDIQLPGMDGLEATAELKRPEQAMIQTIDSEQERTIAMLEKWVNQNSGTMNSA